MLELKIWPIKWSFLDQGWKRRRWNHVAIVIEESMDLITLEFDHLLSFLMSHEQRSKDLGASVCLMVESFKG